MTDVTGQRHDHNRPHPTERHEIAIDKAQRYRAHLAHFVAEAIHIAQRAALNVPGLGNILFHEYQLLRAHEDRQHAESLSLMSALAAGDDPPPLPIALSLAPDGRAVVWLRTRRQWAALRDVWRHRKVGIHSRAALALRDAHDHLDLVEGVTPIRGDDGQVLPGLPALEGLVAREALMAELKTTYLSSAALAGIIAGMTHPVAGTLSTDVDEARAQHMDRFDATTEAHRRWLFDGGDIAVGAAQTTALRLLEQRRQAGRRNLRAATTLTALQSAATAALALVEGVFVEDAPVWRTGGGAAITSGRHSVSYTAPTSGRWTHGLRAANPAGTGAKGGAADLGSVVLDDTAPPAGWTVTNAPRPAPSAADRDIIITWSGTGQPEAGTYSLQMTARNACGPARLTVIISVAPASDGDTA